MILISPVTAELTDAELITIQRALERWSGMDDELALVDHPQPNIEDCGFRMLEPSEYARGMGFPADYRWEGTKRERVKMAGNAVTPPAARDLITIATQALGEAA